MSEEDREQVIRRILVALDASPHSMAALRAAAELAAQFDAELVGLYVEDIHLLRLSELPLAREVSTYSALPRKITRQQIEQQLRTQARQARRAMETMAASSRVRWSFHVAQGVVTFELLSAGGGTDLILLGKAGWSRRSRLGSTTRALVSQATSHVMVLQQGAQLRSPVGLVYDGSLLSQRALLIATHLQRQRISFLVVIILADEVEKARQLQEEVAQWLRQHHLQARFRWLIHRAEGGLVSTVKEEQCGALVLPAESDILPGNALTEILDKMQCPVLVVH